MSNAGVIPTLKEELDRKSLDAAEWLFFSLNTGRIDARQFSTGIDVLFMSVCGLVDGEINQIMSQASEYAESSSPLIETCMVKGNVIMAMACRPADGTVTINTYVNGVFDKTTVKELHDPMKTIEFHALATKLLHSRGYIKV